MTLSRLDKTVSENKADVGNRSATDSAIKSELGVASQLSSVHGYTNEKTQYNASGGVCLVR